MAERSAARRGVNPPGSVPDPAPIGACENGAEPHVRLEMLSQARFLAAARAMISNLAQRLGFSESLCGQISLAVDEALCNVINHGYDRRPDGRIWLSVWALEHDAPRLKIVIEDRARQVDPETIRSRDLEDIRPGGLGVFIIREVMDEVSYEHRDGGGMRLTMSKTVPPTTSPTPANTGVSNAVASAPQNPS